MDTNLSAQATRPETGLSIRKRKKPRERKTEIRNISLVESEKGTSPERREERGSAAGERGRRGRGGLSQHPWSAGLRGALTLGPDSLPMLPL